MSRTHRNIIAMIQEGYTVAETVARIGCSRSYVYFICYTEGIHPKHYSERQSKRRSAGTVKAWSERGMYIPKSAIQAAGWKPGSEVRWKVRRGRISCEAASSVNGCKILY